MNKLGRFWRALRGEPPKYCCAIVLAAGSGSRMGADRNKQYLLLADQPVLAYTLQAFQQAQTIQEILLVAKQEEIGMAADVAAEFGITKVKQVVAGGAQRQDSVRKALMQLPGNCTHVAIHDGARPFILPKTIDEAVKAAYQYNASAVGVPVKDTIKRCDSQGMITETVDRAQLWAVQTPQVFVKELIIGAHAYAADHGMALTDDCMAVEAMGGQVKMIPGQDDNIKITTPADLAVGMAILEKRGEI